MVKNGILIRAQEVSVILSDCVFLETVVETRDKLPCTSTLQAYAYACIRFVNIPSHMAPEETPFTYRRQRELMLVKL